jgi:hypothetical protein
MEINVESKLKSLPEEVQAVLDDNQFNYKLNIIENFKSTKYKSQLNPLPNALSLGPDGEVYLRKRDNSLGPSASIDGVFTILDNLFTESLKTSNNTSMFNRDADGNKYIKFVRYMPDAELELPCIVWKVTMGKPGAFGQGTEMNATAEQRKPFYRETVPDPDNPDRKILVFSQRKDYYIELCVCAKNAHQADEVRAWMEKTIENNGWYFKLHGLNDFLWSERLSDQVRVSESVPIYCRANKYYVSTTTLSWISEKTLDTLIINAELI